MTQIFFDPAVLDKVNDQQWYLICRIMSHMRGNDFAWPKIETLMKSTGWGEKKLKRIAKECIGMGYMTVSPRYTASGRQTSNAYAVNLDEVAIMISSKQIGSFHSESSTEGRGAKTDPLPQNGTPPPRQNGTPLNRGVQNGTPYELINIKGDSGEYEIDPNNIHVWMLVEIDKSDPAAMDKVREAIAGWMADYLKGPLSATWSNLMTSIMAEPGEIKEEDVARAWAFSGDVKAYKLADWKNNCRKLYFWASNLLQQSRKTRRSAGKNATGSTPAYQRPRSSAAPYRRK